MISRPGRLGRVMPGYQLLIDGPGRGELCVDLDPEPVGVTSGYLTGEPRPSKLWRTGDLGEIDSDGWIRIEGRVDDVFQSAGHRISPLELENALARHPAVREVAVVPRPDRERGLASHAVVGLREGWPSSETTVRALLEHAAAVLAEPLCPRSVEFVDALPRTVSGKVRRATMRTASPASTAARSPIGHFDRKVSR
jgi:acetyl-CoA synthetase